MLLRYIHTCLTIFLLFPAFVYCQQNADSNIFSARVSPQVYKLINNPDSAVRLKFVVEFHNSEIYQRVRNSFPLKFFSSNSKSLFSVVECSPAILKQMLRKGWINSVTEHIPPLEEGGVISYDHTINAISAAHDYFPLLNGSGETVSVKENRMDTQDIDLAGRYIDVGTTSSTGSTHATIMTTLIAGLGNTSFKGLGVAIRSRYTSSDFSTVLPDQNSIYQNNHIRIQNHSYGTSVQSFYGNNARAFDLSAIENPELLHIFSSGNSGMLAPQDGKYAGIPGVANLTGNMKSAKNILVVGAIDSAWNIPAASSGGPTYDGRIKPELVAFAEDGSSGSAALVSGSAAVIQQACLKNTIGIPLHSRSKQY